MYKLLFIFIGVQFLSISQAVSQQITFSEVNRQDKGDMNFEIIGKMNSNILIYKNLRWKHKITVLDNNMKEVETTDLDFLPEKTFNVDFVAYSNFAYMVYQYQKKSILYCMVVKIDAMGKKIGEPTQLDTTQISFFADNKIYTTVVSENKEKVAVFKLLKKNDNYTLAIKTFDKEFNLTHQNRQLLNYNDRRDTYDNFSVDNEGNFVFTKEARDGNRSTSNRLSLILLKNGADTLTILPNMLDKNFVDNVTVKIDNLNNQYLINSFYYKKNRGNIEGVFSIKYDKISSRLSTPSFSVIYDSVRDAAKKTGQLRNALDDYFIRQTITKKDGGYIIIAEDFSSQTTGNTNSFNRWNYFGNNSFNDYYYSPYYGYYRPFNNFSNQSVRYYYNNILIMSFTVTGNLQWSRVIQKDQFDDGTDNFLSYAAIPYNGELHFLFNSDKRNQVIGNHSINGSGDVRRNPPLKIEEKGHQFMPRHSKQVGAKQIIIPCDYRGYICFAKVDV
jgi:hypothetical protein